MNMPQRLIKFLCSFFLIFAFYLGAYERPDHVPEDVWEQLKPYFLPQSHKLKKKLDKVFKSRVNASQATVKKAKFRNTTPGRYSHLIVTTHKKIKGAYLKFSTDNNPYVAWPQLKKRVEGALSLQAAIKALGYEKWFKVPRKWIYPLPANLKPDPNAPAPENFILVAEDLHILARDQNYAMWKSKLKPEMLTALFHIIETEGLVDSTVAFNIPFTRDGKIAFIDLEHHHAWPIPYHRLLQYLNNDMQATWRQITENRW